jgi:hypothetical protein
MRLKCFRLRHRSFVSIWPDNAPAFQSDIHFKENIMRWPERRSIAYTLPAAALAVALGTALAPGASAGETEAKALLKAMSDYMASQKSVAITYDNTFEVVTADKQKIAVAASGDVHLMRPDKLRATRHGGFANVEMIIDGKTFTVFGKDANVYMQAPMSGTIDEDINTIREKMHRSLPGADLLSSDIYATLMDGVTDLKDLGSGVIGGKECDHIAARAADIDWQIWIAQGAEPHPFRYVITTREIEGQPQYTLTVTGFKAGDGAVAADSFAFTPPAGATKLEPGDAKGAAALSDMPHNFTMGQ